MKHLVIFVAVGILVAILFMPRVSLAATCVQNIGCTTLGGCATGDLECSCESYQVTFCSSVPINCESGGCPNEECICEGAVTPPPEPTPTETPTPEPTETATTPPEPTEPPGEPGEKDLSVEANISGACWTILGPTKNGEQYAVSGCGDWAYYPLDVDSNGVYRISAGEVLGYNTPIIQPGSSCSISDSNTSCSFQITYTPASANNSACVGYSIPTTMEVSATYPVSVTFQNTGTTTWLRDVPPVYLAAQPFAMARGFTPLATGLPIASVALGGQAEFTFTMTAPDASGTYNGQYQMAQAPRQWFGAVCGPESIVVLGENHPPTVSNISITVPTNYCGISSLDKISWTYSDPDDIGGSDPQSAYQVKIFSGSTLLIDTGQIHSANPYFMVPRNENLFGKTLIASIDVWDTRGPLQNAGASNSPAWTTQSHFWPDAAFTFIPAKFVVGESMAFDGSSSVCYLDNGNPAGGCSAYFWDFGDGATGAGVSPTHAYTNSGSYSTTLTVTDGFGSSCPLTKSMAASKPVPTYKEVIPRR